VAVKVQHRELRRLAKSDVAALDSVFLALHYFYTDLAYLRDAWARWRLTLLDELDFEREAANGDRVRAHFQNDPRFHVPFIYPAVSSHRVLTQEWIHGETLRDLIDKATVVDPTTPTPPPSLLEGSKPLLALAPFAVYGVLKPSDVGLAASDFFAQQLLVHGLVHCDPHPANLMLRRAPGSSSSPPSSTEWQLCVIDWGMVRQLESPFRASFCDLWFNLLTQNSEGAKEATRGMGMMSEDAEALSLFLTFRGVGKGSGKLGAPKTKEEWMKVKKEYEWVTAADVNKFALRLPSDFSFVMRTIALARGLNGSCGLPFSQRLYCCSYSFLTCTHTHTHTHTHIHRGAGG
jgi:aarF domain-containing kinase